MKKQKKHILFFCLLLLLGIFLLSGTGRAYSKNICLPTGSVKAIALNGHKKGDPVSVLPVGGNGAGPIIPDTSSDDGGDSGESESSKETSLQIYAQTVSGTSGAASKPSGKPSGSYRNTNGQKNGYPKASDTQGSNSVPSGGSSSSSGSPASSSAPTSGKSSSSSSPESSSISSGSTTSSKSGNTSSSSGSTSHHSHHTVAITSVSLDKSTLYFPKTGDTATLKATVSPSNTTYSKNITWSSADGSIAAVDKSGKVTAVKSGITKITAKTVNGKTAVCNVTVRIPATKVSLHLNGESEIKIEKGSSLDLSVSVEPADTTDKVSWTTTDNDIVSVDSNGKITAVNSGTATIKATAGNVSAECRVTVGISITKIELSGTDITLEKGNTKAITATIVPSDTTENKNIAWSSSDNRVATVDSSGKVTAVEGGSAVISAQDGENISQCKVTVTVPLTGIKFEPNTVKVTKGKFQKLSPVFTPSDATDNSLTWGSLDQSVAAVDSTGKVTGVNVGTTTITAISHDSGFVAQCTVNVVIPVTGVSLNKTSVSMIKGKTNTLTATTTPADATDKTVTWKSNNANVATVDSSGKITAVEGGSAVITVTTHDGNFTAKCNVTVTVPATGISLNQSSLSIVKGKTDTLTATVTPTDTTDKAVTWSSDNTSVAAVDSTGKVTGINAGSAVITAVSHDGGFTAKCTVNVIIPVTGISLNKTSDSLIKSKTDTLTAAITPTGATDKAVTWKSSDTNVATVDSSGKITATGGGSAVITVTTHDGNFTAKCNVTVTVPATGISLNQSSLSIVKGTYGALTASVSPADATDKAVTWSSDNTSVAAVDSTGKVTGVNTGTAVITATTHNGGYTAKCSVTVTPNEFTVTANAGAGGTVSGGGVYHIGSTCMLTAAANSGYHFVSWSDGNTSATRSFNVTQNVNLTANFKLNAITWTYNIDSAPFGYSGNDSDYSCYVGDELGSNTSNSCTVTYTFNNGNGFMMHKGQTFTFNSKFYRDTRSVKNSVEISLNGNQIMRYSNYNDAYNSADPTKYIFTSDTFVKTITVYTYIFNDANNYKHSGDTDESVTINSNYGSFLLNNSGTSIQ